MQRPDGYGDEPVFPPSAHQATADPHGQAALFLSESILHALLEAKALTLTQAIDAVQTASEVVKDTGEATDVAEGQMQRSLNLLAAIARSLANGGGDPDGSDTVRILRP